MNFLKTSFVLLLLLGAIACDDTQKKEKTLSIDKKKNVLKNTPIEKSWDSLKHHNVGAFFTEYAKLNKETIVVIKTKFGDIKLRLYNNTPIHRANFIFLTKIGYFDTTVFYRVAPNFVIQGGNSDDFYTMKQRHKYGNYLMKPEFRPNRKHKYGALAAAREWENNPDKLSSPFEFYIVQNRKGAHHLDNEHTVFGQVISGFATIDKIANLEAGVDEWPKVDVHMKIEVIK
jgi:peptidylprolyl isomerase